MDTKQNKNVEWGDALRSKVKGAEVAPSAGLWTKIEKTMDSKPVVVPRVAKRTILWRWVGGAAAVAAVLLVVFMVNTAPNMNEVIVAAIDRDEVAAVEIVEPRREDEVASVSQFNDEQADFYTVESADKSNSQSLPIVDQLSKILAEDSAESGVAVEKSNNTENQFADKNNQTPSKSIAQQNLFEPYPEDEGVEVNLPAARMQKTALSLQLSGGLLAQNNTNHTIPKSAAYEALINPQATGAKVSDIYEYCDAVHHQPFSVGVRLQHNFTPRFRLVSGLNYTLLSSDIKYSAAPELFNEKQQLHFIGLPLRADYEFIGGKHFSLYGGGGGAVEYLMAATLGGKSVDENRWHFRAGVAVGAEWKVNRWLGFYFEPEVNYFFRDTKLMTIMDNSPVSFTLRFGVCFTL